MSAPSQLSDARLPGSETPHCAADTRRIGLVVVALGLVTAAIYLNSLGAPFVFDDIPSIPENPSLGSLRTAFAPPGEGLTVSGRPLLNVSFALNHLAGAGPAGFRVTNIGIHLGAGLLLFGLVRRTLLMPRLRFRFGLSALFLATAIGGLWLLHPLQTASVTYLAQRAESLMGLFYFLTLYAFIRSIGSARCRAWLALSVSAALAGMATKEVMVSAPAIVALYDRWFVSSTWSEVWRKRRAYYLALAATWLPLVWLVAGTGGRGGAAGFSLGIGWLDYWATQFHALIRYLALCVWPSPLVFDYGVEWVRHAVDIAPYAIVVCTLVAALALATVRGRPAAWPGLFLFAILAPTSLLPGGRQTLAEHRMYLPLAASLTCIVLALHQTLGRRGVALAFLAAIGLAAATVQRNVDYRTPLSLWADTVAKRPDNRWARDNLGNALLDAGRPADALRQYEAALALAPDDPVHHYNTGNALARLDRLPEAIDRFSTAVRLAPAYVAAHNNLGNALCRLGRFDEAIAHYVAVVEAQPGRSEPHVNLGDAFFQLGRTRDAIAEFRVARRIQPDNADIAYGLGCILLQSGQLAEATREFEHTLTLRPDHAEAAANLGSAFAQLGRVDDALRALRDAVRLNPANPEAHNNLGAIYLHVGQLDAALAEFTATLRLAPDHVMARQNLARLQRGKPAP